MEMNIWLFILFIPSCVVWMGETTNISMTKHLTLNQVIRTLRLNNNVSLAQPSLFSTLFDGNYFTEHKISSSETLCAMMGATKDFNGAPETVILVDQEHEFVVKDFKSQCNCIHVFYMWRLPFTASMKQILVETESWVDKGIRKFVLFCSLEKASILLGTIGNLFEEQQVLFFVFDRRVLYTSLGNPSLMIAIEMNNNRTPTDYKDAFNVENELSGFSLFAHQYQQNRWRQYGSISKKGEIIYQSTDRLQGYHTISRFKVRRRTLNVVTIVEAPYMLVHKHSKELYNPIDNTCQLGRVCWQKGSKDRAYCCFGYLVDLLEKIEEDLAFTSYLYFVEDDTYGEVVNGTWVGMVGDLVTKKADLALASLTINGKRAEVVDFSLPFIVGGIALITLYRDDHISFANIEPFKSLSVYLWLGTLLIPSAMVAVLVAMNRSSGKYYSWNESFTYIMGLMFQRDIGGKNPVTLSSKTISIFVALFTLVIMSTYTAVLTANSVTSTRSLPITGFKDQKIQSPTNSFKFGTVANSAYTQLFSNSEDPVWRRMAMFMKRYNFRNTTKAFQQLKDGKLHAIIHDYYIAYHHMSKDNECRFKFAGDTIKDGGSGLAVQKDSALVDELSSLLMKYQDWKLLQKLQHKWMINQCIPKDSEVSSNTGGTVSEIGTRYFGGLFIMLSAFSAFTVVILALEKLVYQFRRPLLVK